MEDKMTSLDPCLWPSYKLHDNSDSAKMSGTRSSFLPVVAVQVGHLLVQLWMTPLLSFHPHSFLSHLPPPELLAILPKVKVKANKRLFLIIFYFLKRQNKIKSQAPKLLCGLGIRTGSLNILYSDIFFFISFLNETGSTCIHNRKPDTAQKSHCSSRITTKVSS